MTQDVYVLQLTEGLGHQEYETATSGSREIDASRILGEGAACHARRLTDSACSCRPGSQTCSHHDVAFDLSTA